MKSILSLIGGEWSLTVILLGSVWIYGLLATVFWFAVIVGLFTFFEWLPR